MLFAVTIKKPIVQSLKKGKNLAMLLSVVKEIYIRKKNDVTTELRLHKR